MFSAIDTPNGNLPQTFPDEFFPIFFALVEQVAPDVSNLILGDAINMRLGTNGISIKELGLISASKGLTISEVMAMPELDSYTYSDGKSMVCSNFLAGLWKAAGLFGDLEVNANEFTPYDVYRINFFDPNLETPEHCQRNDPG